MGKFMLNKSITSIKHSPRWLLILGVAGILVLSVAAYFYFRSKGDKVRGSLVSLSSDNQALITQLGKVMELPADELPTIATISDENKLAGIPALSKAKNGNKLVVYPRAGRAILFDPAKAKIIDVISVNLTSQATPSAQPSETAQTTFVIRNGTTTVGMAKKYESVVKSALERAVVVSKEDTKVAGLSRSLLIDVKGDKGEMAKAIAVKLGLAVSSLPAGEATAEADFIIILGEDKAGGTGTGSQSKS